MTLTVPIFRDAADIVAAEVEQHQMLGALLGVGQQLGSPAPRPRAGVAPRRRVPAIGRMVTVSSRNADQDFRAGADDLEVREVEIEQEGRGIDAAQRAVERERRQGEGRLEALRQHDLEDVAGADVVLRLQSGLRPMIE